MKIVDCLDFLGRPIKINDRVVIVTTDDLHDNFEIGVVNDITQSHPYAKHIVDVYVDGVNFRLWPTMVIVISDQEKANKRDYPEYFI